MNKIVWPLINSSPKIDNNSLLKTKIPTMTAALTKKLIFVEKRMSFL